ncbi:hypothetical protein AMTR_s00031p00141310 [Amborella trichopoda]|uniref:Uncharacterized protein n=1 Tax=Amborella trichopoda TaxID=13333 RepID=U5D858_AMBTC|nr:hypothetical protein AMTR_s00031p00141310 [Amborella trichopoda]
MRRWGARLYESRDDRSHDDGVHGGGRTVMGPCDRAGECTAVGAKERGDKGGNTTCTRELKHDQRHVGIAS